MLNPYSVMVAHDMHEYFKFKVFVTDSVDARFYSTKGIRCTVISGRLSVG